MQEIPRTFFVFTTGCKANQWDSHVLALRLEEAGMARCGLDLADLIVVNACSLTARAETDARRFIQRSRHVNPHARVALVGCHAQAYPGRDFGADLVLGQAEKFDAARYLPEKGRFVEKGRAFAIEKAGINGGQKDRTRFFFKIQDGCNRFCTYCIVPYARGAGRSRPATDVAATMASLRDRGINEVVLTGIDIAAYHDPASGEGLKGLLRLLEGLDTPGRIRLSSVDPEYIDDDFIRVLASSGKIAKSIHIPVQSGSDRVLRAMGRSYSSDFVRHVVENLRRAMPAIGVGMDIMAGFPGEDEASFGETCELVESADVSYLHVFPYSEREGTAAAAFDGKVPERVLRGRVRRLKAIDAEKREAFLRRFIGEKVRIIPEAKVYRGGLMRGFSDNYLPVYIPYEKALENNLVNVTITEMRDSTRLIGGLTCL
ncbi:MAG: MiaB/RimO family radical SAM methylthiotransferase [Syntrophorhabdales bacterium]|jgi:threonylcarbamoyladenosine tRNA methylthiotransferase MtaB